MGGNADGGAGDGCAICQGGTTELPDRQTGRGRDGHDAF